MIKRFAPSHAVSVWGSRSKNPEQSPQVHPIPKPELSSRWRFAVWAWAALGRGWNVAAERGARHRRRF